MLGPRFSHTDPFRMSLFDMSVRDREVGRFPPPDPSALRSFYANGPFGGVPLGLGSTGSVVGPPPPLASIPNHSPSMGPLGSTMNGSKSSPHSTVSLNSSPSSVNSAARINSHSSQNGSTINSVNSIGGIGSNAKQVVEDSCSPTTPNNSSVSPAPYSASTKLIDESQLAR